MAGSKQFDPNHVRYQYVSRRILSEIVAQERAGRSRWSLTGVSAASPHLPLTPTFTKRADFSDFDLVRRAEEILEFGTISAPGQYTRGTVHLEGFHLHVTEEGYRVALFRPTLFIQPQVVLIGSLENVLGALPDKEAQNHGFRPSFSGTLPALLDHFRADKRRRRFQPLPTEPEAVHELVTDAANFAFDLGAGDDDVQLLAGRYEVAFEVWFEATEVDVVSLRRGGRMNWGHVLVGTPLWIRDPAPKPVE